MNESKYFSKDLELLQNQIIALKDYISSLFKRLSLIKINFANKTNYEKNEVEIVIYETKYLITKKLFTLKCLEKDFQTKLTEHNEKVNEVNNNYESLLHTIMNFYQDNVEIKHYLYPINWSKINNDFGLKMELYFSLKSLINSLDKKI